MPFSEGYPGGGAGAFGVPRQKPNNRPVAPSPYATGPVGGYPELTQWTQQNPGVSPFVRNQRGYLEYGPGIFDQSPGGMPPMGPSTQLGMLPAGTMPQIGATSANWNQGGGGRSQPPPSNSIMGSSAGNQTPATPGFPKVAGAVWPGATPKITSQIQPQGMYSPRSTQMAINQALAGGHQAAYGQPTASLQGFAGTSPGLLSRSAMGGAEALAGSQQEAEGIRLGDRAANLQTLLAGQTARGMDVLGQGRNMGMLDAMNRGFGTRMGGQLIDATTTQLGGIGRQEMEQLMDRQWWGQFGLQQQQANMGQMGSLMNALNWI